MTSYLTPEGFKKLKEELDYLENVKKKEIAEKLKIATAFGDFKENAAYDDAKEAQGFLQGRILKLKEIISSVKLLEKKGSEQVEIGSTVLLSSDNKKEEFQIVGPEEADVLNGKISYKSPLGELILGKTKGKKIILKTPEANVEYKILEIK